MAGKIQIVVVDDHAMFREGVISLLAYDPDFEVVGQGGSAEEAIRLACDLSPGIILLDIDMPGNSFAAARKIALQSPTTRIAFLTVSEAEDHLSKAFKTGARAYILKGVSGRELMRILKAVNTGETYVPPALANVLTFE